MRPGYFPEVLAMNREPQDVKRYLVQLQPMGAAAPETYETTSLNTARGMFLAGCDGMFYRCARLVELKPHAGFELLDFWGTG